MLRLNRLLVISRLFLLVTLRKLKSEMKLDSQWCANPSCMKHLCTLTLKSDKQQKNHSLVVCLLYLCIFYSFMHSAIKSLLNLLIEDIMYRLFNSYVLLMWPIFPAFEKAKYVNMFWTEMLYFTDVCIFGGWELGSQNLSLCHCLFWWHWDMNCLSTCYCSSTASH